MKTQKLQKARKYAWKSYIRSTLRPTENHAHIRTQLFTHLPWNWEIKLRRNIFKYLLWSLGTCVSECVSLIIIISHVPVLGTYGSSALPKTEPEKCQEIWSIS